MTKSKEFLLFFSFLLTPFSLWSQQDGPVRITERFVQVPIVSALDQLEYRYRVLFFYQEEWFRDDTLNIVLRNTTIEESVKRILTDKPFIYRIIDNNKVVFVLKEKAAVFLEHIPDYSDEDYLSRDVILIGDIENAGKSRTAVIAGQIIDGKTNEPVTGATVQVNNLPAGAV